MNTTPTPKGGARPGSGRKKRFDTRLNLRLTNEQLEFARRLGEGDACAGIRIALAACYVPPGVDEWGKSQPKKAEKSDN